MSEDGLEAFGGAKQQFRKVINKRLSEALQQSLRRCEVLEGLEAFGGAKQQFRKATKTEVRPKL